MFLLDVRFLSGGDSIFSKDKPSEYENKRIIKQIDVHARSVVIVPATAMNEPIECYLMTIRLKSVNLRLSIRLNNYF